MEWQPIETAKDCNEWFLAWMPSAKEGNRIYIVGCTPHEHHYDFVDFWGIYYSKRYPKFTHWQPLPEPPAES